MAQENRVTIENEINNQLAPNNQKKITAEILQDFQRIISDSKFNLIDDDINSIKVDANDSNSQTLGQYIDESSEHSKLESAIRINAYFDPGLVQQTYAHSSVSENYGTFTLLSSTSEGIPNGTLYTRTYSHSGAGATFTTSGANRITVDTLTVDETQQPRGLLFGFDDQGILTITFTTHASGQGSYREELVIFTKRAI